MLLEKRTFFANAKVEAGRLMDGNEISGRLMEGNPSKPVKSGASVFSFRATSVQGITEIGHAIASRLEAIVIRWRPSLPSLLAWRHQMKRIEMNMTSSRIHE